jgi:LacI family transcriptional regulator
VSKRKSASHNGFDQQIRLLDLARELGVSPTTISRALRGKQGMSESTRDRIKKAARAFGYVPNKAGASLSTGRVFSIGYLLLKNEQGQQGQLQNEVMRGMVDELALFGYSLTVFSEDYFRVEKGAIFDAAQKVRVDALAVTIEHNEPVKPPSSPLPFPLAVINRRLDAIDASFVLADEERGGQLATSHLIELGHRKIACIGGPLDHAALALRQEGYAGALVSAGIGFDPSLVEHAPEISWRGGYAACEALFRRHDDVTAIFCGSDILAFGVLKCLEAKGLSVPGDVAVGSFDDSLFADITDPALTSVRKLRQAMGREAARLLLARLNGDTVPSEVILPVELIVRKSSGVAIS